MLKKLLNYCNRVYIKIVEVSIVAAILIFSIVLIYRFVREPELFNENIKSFGFPIAFILVALLFRKSISFIIEKITEFSLRWKDAEIKATTKDFAIGVSELYEKTNADSNQSKEEIVKYMELAAAWGYNMAQIGFKSTPVPSVEWTANGPEIKFGTGKAFTDNFETDRVISEILKVRKEILSLSSLDKMNFGFNPSREKVLNDELEYLKSILKKLDPISVFLD